MKKRIIVALSSFLLASGIGLANTSNKVEAVSKYSTKYHWAYTNKKQTFHKLHSSGEYDSVGKNFLFRVKYVPKYNYFQVMPKDILEKHGTFIVRGKNTNWFRNTTDYETSISKPTGAKHSLNSSYWTKYRRVKVLKATTFKRFDALTRRYIGGSKTFHRGNVIKVRAAGEFPGWMLPGSGRYYWVSEKDNTKWLKEY